MDSNDEDDITSIVNQIRSFGNKKEWLCCSLQSALNAVNAKVEKLENNISVLKSSLSEKESSLVSATAKNKTLQSKAQTFESLWVSSKDEIEHLNQQNKNLKSSLSANNAKLKELESSIEAARAENEILITENGKFISSVSAKNVKLQELKSSLDVSIAENKALLIEIERLKSSLKTSEKTIEELGSKCTSLESSLIETKNVMETTNTNCKISNSALCLANAKNAELNAKCETLQTSLSAANAKINELELEIKESKKENITNAESLKKNVVMATLKKLEGKMFESPLFPILNRFERNIEKLSEIEKKQAPYSKQNDLKIERAASSDDDDRSTLSYVSDGPFDEIDQLDGSPPYAQADDAVRSTMRVVSEEAVRTMPASSSSTDSDDLEHSVRNFDENIAIEIDDASHDSDFSLKVCSDVSTSTIEEEHSYSSERPSNKPIPLSLDSNKSTDTSVISKNSTTTSNENEREESVAFDDADTMKLPLEKDRTVATLVPEPQSESNALVISNLNYNPISKKEEKELKRLQKIVENLAEKNNIKNVHLVHPVVLLTRWEDRTRSNDEFEDSTECSASKDRPLRRNSALKWSGDAGSKCEVSRSPVSNGRGEYKCRDCDYGAETTPRLRRHEILSHGVVRMTRKSKASSNSESDVFRASN